MHFKIIHSRGRSRAGVITTVDEKLIETPSCLVYTRCGAVPHLVKDLLQNMGNTPPVVQLTLPTLFDQPSDEVMKSQGKGINTFLGIQGFVSLLTIQDPAQDPPSGYNEDKSVSVWNTGGRRKINVEQFTKKISTFRPNMTECLCDTIPATGQTAKRIKKSVDRTLKFLDEVLEYKDKNEALSECALLGAIEGSDCLDERLRSARETSTRPVSGFVLEGFDAASSSDWTSLLQCTVDVLPKDKPRVLQGISAPDYVISAVECGVDLFDSSFPYQVAERGCALVFANPNKRLKPEVNYDTVSRGSVPSDSETADVLKTTGNPSEEECPESTEQPSKNINDGLKDGNGKTRSQRTDYEIDLHNTRYSTDMSPVESGCACYCCTNHTRAYIHHLLVTKEMLAGVLLMTHNLHRYFKFFKEIRQALAADRWQEFKDLHQMQDRRLSS